MCTAPLLKPDACILQRSKLFFIINIFSNNFNFILLTFFLWYLLFRVIFGNPLYRNQFLWFTCQYYFFLFSFRINYFRWCPLNPLIDILKFFSRLSYYIANCNWHFAFADYAQRFECWGQIKYQGAPKRSSPCSCRCCQHW